MSIDPRKHPLYQGFLGEQLARDAAREDAAEIKAEVASDATGWTTFADLRNLTVAPPDTLQTAEGGYLANLGKITTLFGGEGAGKTLLTTIWAAQFIAAGCHVLWLDFEDQVANAADMLRTLGVDDDAIEKHMHVPLHPDGPPTDQVKAVLAANIAAWAADGPVLAVADAWTGLQERVAPETTDNDKAAVERVQTFLRWLASCGATVVNIDHIGHEGTREAGNRRKRSGTDASFEVRTVVEFSATRDGYAAVVASRTSRTKGTFVKGDTVAYIVARGGRLQFTSQRPSDEGMAGTVIPVIFNKVLARSHEVEEKVATEPGAWTQTKLAQYLAKMYATDVKLSASISTWRRATRELLDLGTLRQQDTADGPDRLYHYSSCPKPLPAAVRPADDELLRQLADPS